MQQTGGNQTSVNPQGVNLATRVRPSDQAGAPGDPNNPTTNQPNDPNATNAPNAAFNPNAPPNTPPFPNSGNAPVQVLPDGRIVPVSQGQQGFPQQGFPQQGNGLPPGAQLPPGIQLPPGVSVQPGAMQGAIPGQPQ